MNTEDQNLFSVSISRSFPTSRERLCQAWLSPDDILHWCGPSDWPVVDTELQATPGGIWRFTLKSTATGDTLIQSGVYKTITVPTELSFTFGWEVPGVPRYESVVRLLFSEEAGITSMSFYLSPCQTEESRESHREAWEDSFSRLYDYLQLA